MQLKWKGIMNCIIIMTSFTSFHTLLGILERRRPMVFKFKDFLSQGSGEKMVTDYPMVYFIKIVDDILPLSIISTGWVDKSLLYKVPTITKYELAFLFIRAASVVSEGSIPCLINFIMGDIQEGRDITSSMAIVIIVGILMLEPLNVSWVKEWFSLEERVLEISKRMPHIVFHPLEYARFWRI